VALKARKTLYFSLTLCLHIKMKFFSIVYAFFAFFVFTAFAQAPLNAGVAITSPVLSVGYHHA
jgi:hypothetical protein